MKLLVAVSQSLKLLLENIGLAALYSCYNAYHSCAGGTPPTGVTAEQSGVNTVLVMWTAPSPPPTGGYQVQITRGSTTTTVNVAGTSYTASSLEHSGYTFHVKSFTQHFPSETTEPVEITVRGKRAPCR